MKYAHYDSETNKLLGYYDSEIHNTIPEPNIELTDEEWKKYVNDNCNYVDIENNVLLRVDFRTIDERKTSLYNSIQLLADSKTRDLKNYISGKKVTQEQMERYEAKYNVALQCKESGDYSVLELEAELQGMEPEDLADLIIEKHDELIEYLNKYSAMIEAYRVKAQTIVDSIETLDEIEKAQILLDKAKEFDINTTEDDIKALFEEYEND